MPWSRKRFVFFPGEVSATKNPWTLCTMPSQLLFPLYESVLLPLLCGNLHVAHYGCRSWIAILCWSHISPSLLEKYVAVFVSGQQYTYHFYFLLKKGLFFHPYAFNKTLYIKIWKNVFFSSFLPYVSLTCPRNLTLNSAIRTENYVSLWTQQLELRIMSFVPSLYS